MQVFLFPLYYPFAEVNEIFIAEELRCVAEYSDVDFTIVPFKQKGDERRAVPDRIHVDASIIKRTQRFSILTLFLLAFRATFWRFFTQEVLRKLVHFRLPARILFARFIRALFIADYLVAKYNQGEIDQGTILYSYWLDEATAGFYLATKICQPLKACLIVARAHRWDIIEPQARLPFRKQGLTVLDKIVVASDFGLEEVRHLYPEVSAKSLSCHLGVADVCAPRNDFTLSTPVREFVSCSTVVPVKRVALIYENIAAYALQYPSLRIHWVHFGDGTLMPELREVTKTPPANLQVELRGMIPNPEVRRYLASVEGAILVHLSLHEATPIAIQEALSASIPVIATDGGGVHEAIDDTVGALLPLDFSKTEWIAAADRLWANYSQYMQAARKRFESLFQSRANYLEFYNDLRLWHVAKSQKV